MPTLAAGRETLMRRILGRVIWSMLVAASGSQTLLAEEDPYLSAITQEASKVEAEVQPAPNAEGAAVNPADGGPSLQAFEDDLKTRYVGSYTFYGKLPQRTREEIFQEYRDGASMEEIRKKIMDRFLHQ